MQASELFCTSSSTKVYLRHVSIEEMFAYPFSFIHSFVRSFVRSLFVRSFIHSFIHAFIHSFIHSCMHACMHAFIHSFIHSFIVSSLHPFIHSSIHPSIDPSIYLHNYSNRCLSFVQLHVQHICTCSCQQLNNTFTYSIYRFISIRFLVHSNCLVPPIG